MLQNMGWCSIWPVETRVCFETLILIFFCFKSMKLKLRLLDDSESDTNTAAPPHLPVKIHLARPTPTFPLSVPPSLPLSHPTSAALTFANYQSARYSSIDDQFSFITGLRAEVPAAERDAIDVDLLRDLAKQLALCVFPTAKMMQVDPVKVKRMLDEEFRRAYGDDVADEKEDKAPARQGLGETNVVAGAVLRENVTGVGVDKYAPGEGIGELVGGAGRVEGEPPKKKSKTVQTDVRKEVKAYQARRKRGRRLCRVVTLRSKPASEAWDEMIHGRV